MGHNYLTGRDGDRINAVLAAAGHNFSLLLRWFEELLRVLSLILCHALLAAPLHLTGAAKLSSRPTTEGSVLINCECCYPMLRLSSDAVATSREDHRKPR